MSAYDHGAAATASDRTRPELLQPGTIEHNQALNDMRLLGTALRKRAPMYISAKDRGFIGTMLDRFERFGNRTFVSRKQGEWLAEIVSRNRWLLQLVPANDNKQLDLLPKPE